MYGTTGEERESIQSGIVKDLEELLERNPGKKFCKFLYQRKVRGNWNALVCFYISLEVLFYLLIMVNSRGRLNCCVS